MVGLPSPKTVKLLGMIGGRQVVVTIDLRATHNFISTKTVEELQIPATGSTGFGVSLGNRISKGNG